MSTLPSVSSDPWRKNWDARRGGARRQRGLLLGELHLCGTDTVAKLLVHSRDASRGHVDEAAAAWHCFAIFMILKFGNVRKRTLSQHHTFLVHVMLHGQRRLARAGRR